MKINYVGNKPEYMSLGAAGADLRAASRVRIDAGEQMMISTGTKLQLQEGTAGLLLPRSSLCNKFGLTLVNSVGLLDSDYIGDIKFCYKNTHNGTIVIKEGERIGQVVIIPFFKAVFKQVEELEKTDRGEGGFGSTGV